MAETLIELLEGPVGASVMAGSAILAALVIGVWWTIAAFLIEWWWGVLTLFFPPTFVLLCPFHFRRLWKPLACGLILLLISLGIFLMRVFLAAYFVGSQAVLA